MNANDSLDRSTRQLIDSLQERAKELNCLYRVDEILNRLDVSPDEVYTALIDVLPSGWMYPEVCRGQLSIRGNLYPPERLDYPWRLAAPVRVHGEPIGELVVFYTELRPRADHGPFLKEERRLIHALAERIGLFVLQRQLHRDRASWKSAVTRLSHHDQQQWQVLLEFLRRTDPALLQRITRKMLNHLCWTGVAAAEALLRSTMHVDDGDELDENRPMRRRATQPEPRKEIAELTDTVFDLASKHLSDVEIISNIQMWINEEKSTFLIKSLENPGSGLAEMAEAVERYREERIDEHQLSMAVRTSLRVALLRRFLVDQLDFINVAKRYVDIRDFYDLVQHLIYPSDSQGKLGGKGAGLFLASQVIAKAQAHHEVLARVKIPKTWYVASDAILAFLQYNGLNEVFNRKYMEIERVRQDYPHIIQVFKDSRFPPEIVKGLATALDDFEGQPLVVRSSSLLEDRMGSAFSGKYKSLFLANQGTKRERLAALQDAIAEIYASVFGPDPIEYRAERGLLDFREEMGILIQEVVGQRVGHYFLPAFSGVAFSNNEFRWSPRIKREDGLVRMVPGLGTRAVDRLADDYPVLFSPGQPGLRVNATTDEIVRYAPRSLDVIDLEENRFVTVSAEELLRETGEGYPGARDLVSIVDGDRVRRPMGLEPDWQEDTFVLTFEGLVSDPQFVELMQSLLEVLREGLQSPVDVEFASDGIDFYLVQCRSQSYGEESAPTPIPPDLPRERIVFSSRRNVSDGRVPEITHIVYVDPEHYGDLTSVQAMRDVGRAVGRLNQLLPRRQFILIGPGRWGSRGDIRLGVSVRYSDISNTAALVEVARQKGGYLPELSFGTHFFQDLVESNIRYIPLYPDDPESIFDEAFLTRSRNVLIEMLPEFGHLADTLRVIDVPQTSDGCILRVLMNADLEQVVALLDERSATGSSMRTVVAHAPGGRRAATDGGGAAPVADAASDDHWRWRQRMAETIAAQLDAERFGVEAFYLFGSTKNGNAGPNSDIDLLVHVRGTPEQRGALLLWLDGWSRSLAEFNYLRTGYRSDGLLDVHLVTDEDIERRTSFAVKIGAVTDAARPLELRRRAVATGEAPTEDRGSPPADPPA
ncbi:MAG: PEP/pyruvate-binding domain-containing protein [Candidatus Eiseniibacteriota bacterium]|jgi:predicted nucleotidyltransferase